MGFLPYILIITLISAMLACAYRSCYMQFSRHHLWFFNAHNALSFRKFTNTPLYEIASNHIGYSHPYIRLTIWWLCKNNLDRLRLSALFLSCGQSDKFSKFIV